MDNVIQNALEKLKPTFEVIEQCLNEWNGEGCLQVPALIASVSIKLNLDEKQMREVDPLVRFYVRNNSNYIVTRGAHGGIMRVSDKIKKDSERAAKEAIKAQLKAKIEGSENV